MLDARTDLLTYDPIYSPKFRVTDNLNDEKLEENAIQSYMSLPELLFKNYQDVGEH